MFPFLWILVPNIQSFTGLYIYSLFFLLLLWTFEAMLFIKITYTYKITNCKLETSIYLQRALKKQGILQFHSLKINFLYFTFLENAINVFLEFNFAYDAFTYFSVFYFLKFFINSWHHWCLSTAHGVKLDSIKLHEKIILMYLKQIYELYIMHWVLKFKFATVKSANIENKYFV